MNIGGISLSMAKISTTISTPCKSIRSIRQTLSKTSECMDKLSKQLYNRLYTNTSKYSIFSFSYVNMLKISWCVILQTPGDYPIKNTINRTYYRHLLTLFK